MSEALENIYKTLDVFSGKSEPDEKIECLGITKEIKKVINDTFEVLSYSTDEQRNFWKTLRERKANV